LAGAIQATPLRRRLFPPAEIVKRALAEAKLALQFLPSRLAQAHPNGLGTISHRRRFVDSQK
jgi:hypothetical protein